MVKRLEKSPYAKDRAFLSLYLKVRDEKMTKLIKKLTKKLKKKKRNNLIYTLRTEEERNPARSLTSCSFDSTLEFIHVDIAD